MSIVTVLKICWLERFRKKKFDERVQIVLNNTLKQKNFKDYCCGVIRLSIIIAKHSLMVGSLFNFRSSLLYELKYFFNEFDPGSE